MSTPSFWAGFEKQAISQDYIAKKTVGGIMQRAGEDPNKGGFAKHVHEKLTAAARNSKPITKDQVGLLNRATRGSGAKPMLSWLKSIHL